MWPAWLRRSAKCCKPVARSRHRCFPCLLRHHRRLCQRSLRHHQPKADHRIVRRGCIDLRVTKKRDLLCRSSQPPVMIRPTMKTTIRSLLSAFCIAAGVSFAETKPAPAASGADALWQKLEGVMEEMKNPKERPKSREEAMEKLKK